LHRPVAIDGGSQSQSQSQVENQVEILSTEALPRADTRENDRRGGDNGEPGRRCLIPKGL
jgi:hypothetical protein